VKTIVTKKIIGNKFAARRAFTLIELLTVIAVIGVLAALLFPAFSAVKRHALINHATTEMAQLETAIDRYKAAYGFYPPSNANTANSLTNQLYFELVGTTNLDVNTPVFLTLDSSAQINAGDATTTFGVGGFMNCNKPGAGEDAPKARNFLPDLKPNQIATLYTNGSDVVKIIVSSVGGPDQNYQPLGFQGANPWRYNSSSPVNNPGSYDLWIQLVIGGKTNLICNWSKQVQINSPLP
jgi:prepilin-type N-terminal cleavage/methylation domain-containing protein